MQKTDFKKELKELFNPPKTGFALVEVPEMQFLMIDGEGDPNTTPAFATGIEALYGIAYAVKFALKKSESGLDYVVPPLEGLWWWEGVPDFDPQNRSSWRWTLMIMQPPQVTEDMVWKAAEQLAAKGKQASFGDVRLERFKEGLSVQTLYIGPYCDEMPAIEKMHRYAADSGYHLHGKHHEIYLSDPRRTQPEKLKTILRQPVAA